MKIDTDLVKKMLQNALDDTLREVNDEMLLADSLDKMYNFGAQHMFYLVLTKIYEAEKIAREVSA